MWSKDILNRYADTLETEQGKALKREVDVIQFGEGTEVCIAIEGERAFARAGIASLYKDLVSRLLEFIQDEDIQH